MALNVKFPDKLQCLFLPKRYKILWGGRGASRSWSVARALLLIGAQRSVRVLCARELQNSITESVHKLLSDQINNLGLGDFYEIQVARIIGKNGTSFSFEGIKNNVTKIKSYEGIDYCWVEEANKVSRASWENLIPTVRKEECPNGHKRGENEEDVLDSDGHLRCQVCNSVLNESEIWMTFNPDLETDYTYSRFVADPPVNAFVVKMTWRDNPWFPRVLLSEMEDLQKRDYDAYLNVWEGNPRRMLEGVVFKEQLRAVEAENRICDVPWDRETPVDTFWDLGRRDMTSIWFGQRVAMQYRMLAYLENAGPDIHWYLKELQKYPYTYGTFYLPHDASAKRLGEKRTIEQIVRGMGHTVRIIPRTSKKVNAINAARVVFPSVWFDSKGTKLGMKRLRHYAYRITDGQRSEEPLHDENSNGADAFMTMAQAIQGPKAPSTLLEKLTRATYREYEQGSQGLGWLA